MKNVLILSIDENHIITKLSIIDNSIHFATFELSKNMNDLAEHINLNTDIYSDEVVVVPNNIGLDLIKSIKGKGNINITNPKDSEYYKIFELFVTASRLLK